jgi:hypothetical protein
VKLEGAEEIETAGETACATNASRLSAMVGQAVSPALPACGRILYSF